MRRLTCASCGASLGADQIDRRLGIITCSHCGSIFELTKRRPEQGADDEMESSELDEYRAIAPLPKKFRLREQQDGMKISWRWLNRHGLFLAFFAIAWDAFLVNWFAASTPIFFKIFAIAHVAAGVGLTYTAIAYLLNTTTVSLTKDRLRVWHWPLPWLPAPTIKTSNIEQFYVVEELKKDSDGDFAGCSYHLNLVTKDNVKRKIVTNFDEVEPALFLEQTFEQMLGIKDRPVAGEIPVNRRFRT